ncbi:MAG: dihydropteroate synthase [Lewinellaceae bacterium]|nr:dihydropteroate synthase [Saprospiraceae bacterium]MCB9330731.1 dihydropteroate synthase [Lewinellaceae bacterium]
MGILNITPDSFYDGGRLNELDAVLRQAESMLTAGAVLLDIGGASSRPGADAVPESKELQRILPVVEAIARRFPEAFISIDTWRAEVAVAALGAGAVLVNDISAGKLDLALYPAVAQADCPYVLMHMQGTPETMQTAPEYDDVVQEVLDFFIEETDKLRALGIKDIVLDPGFGFGKSVRHNYQLLQNLEVFSSTLDLPVLAGLSRKSMICKVLHVNPDRALNGTTALHMVALQRGANILRVHDVREAVEVIQLWQQL